MRNSPWRTGSIHQASMQAVKHGFLTKWSYNGLSCTISPRARLTRIASSWGRFVDVAIESGATSRVGDAAAETLEVLFCRRPRARLLGRLHARLRGSNPRHRDAASTLVRRARGQQVVHP